MDDLYLWRILFINFVQTGSGILCVIFSYIIYKKRFNKLTQLLFYALISYAIGSITIGIIMFIQSPLQLYLHLIALYFIFMMYPFFYLFFSLLCKVDPISSYNKNRIILFVVLFSFIILFIEVIYPNRIQLNSATNWNPQFSWEFLISIFIFFLPLNILIIKNFIIRYLNSMIKVFKRKLLLLFIVVQISFFYLFGATIYNTGIDNNIYRFIYSLLFLILLIPTSIIIYLLLRKIIREK